MTIPPALPSEEEAMIVPVGAPMEPEFALFQGHLAEARLWVGGLPPEERDAIAIWTPGHIFTAAQLLAEAPGHEHDPLAKSA